MDRLKQVLARVLNVPADTITDQSSPDTVESWDSFNGLMLVSELEKEFSTSFTMDEVVSVKKVADIIRILKYHGVKDDEL